MALRFLGREGAAIAGSGCFTDTHPMIVDDTSFGDGIVIKQVHTLPRGLSEMGCCYAIAWQKRDGIVVPAVMRGSHKFLDESKTCSFGPNQGYVGRMSEALDSMDHEVISNMFFIDPRKFLRKHAALLNGISSVLFIPHSAGMLLEMGFSMPHDADESLPLLLANHALAMDQCVLAEKQSGFSFPSRGRNSTAALRTRTPSPEHCQNDSGWPSIGSKGHPLCCQLPCKYIRKRKGCKDGLNCMRCHLCHFSKSGAKNSFNLEHEFKTNALLTLGIAAPDQVLVT